MQQGVTLQESRRDAAPDREAHGETLDDCLREQPRLMLSWLEIAERYADDAGVRA